jgi:hypothetical protein
VASILRGLTRYAHQDINFALGSYRTADPWLGLGRGKPRPYILDIKREVLGRFVMESKNEIMRRTGQLRNEAIRL